MLRCQQAEGSPLFRQLSNGAGVAPTIVYSRPNWVPAGSAARIGHKSISLVHAAEVQGLPSGVGPLLLSCSPFGPLAFGDGHSIPAGG